MTRRVPLLVTASVAFALAALCAAAPATAQDQAMADMPGMKVPAKKTATPAPSSPAAHHGHDMQGMNHAGMDHSGMNPAPAPAAATPQAAPAGEHAGHDMSAMPAPQPAAPAGEHGGHDMAAMPATQQTGTNLPAGDAPAPALPGDHYADRVYSPAEMARARHEMMKEEGAQTFSLIMFNLAEYNARNGRDGYRWDAEGWFGGDINRFVVKSEGEGAFREGVESAEIQALYSRAIGPYFNLQAGLRYDFRPNPARTYAVVGVEGLAPYWFEVGGSLFLSNKGELLGRLEGYYDQRLTQRLVLQPRVELDFAAQDVPETRTGAGLSTAELGLRLRYEITRQFAPYIGVSYDAKAGQTARYARADGEDPTTVNFVMGTRIWF
ncbi:copper resistance protein B [Sphingomonas lycopersici]|uniref:Copper resistance protein B n=1 Tax=Sphingomonas lycopersici TaxID=2951807 RepID=A0AA41ZA28_9SPHN|nr:copper resistance protein B [Sphingomonas lycopersici]MCW6536230.1 copper resistance protein B [Sphingomonas lycopersici]